MKSEAVRGLEKESARGTQVAANIRCASRLIWRASDLLRANVSCHLSPVSLVSLP